MRVQIPPPAQRPFIRKVFFIKYDEISQKSWYTYHMKFRWLTKKQIWIIVFTLILTALLIDLNTRISTLKYLTDQKLTLEADVINLKSTLEIVSEQVDYANSDTAVEEWARQQGMMMKEGDHVIIPLPVDEPTVVPTPVPTVEPTQVENWQVWRDLFFD